MSHLCKMLKYLAVITGVAVFVSCGGPVGTIEINSTPSGADVYLDDTTTSQQTDCVLEDVPEGEHTIKLVLEDYADWDTTVTVMKNEVITINAQLSQATGSIDITSTPTQATISLDGTNTGYTTDCIVTNVLIGSHVLKLTLPGYADWIDTVEIVKDDTITVDAELVLIQGTLIWRYQTQGAVVSSPACAYDMLIVGSYDGYLYAIDEGDGSLKWRYQTDGEVRSSPAIGPDGLIYVGSLGSYLYAINPDDGTLEWKYQTAGPVYSSPAAGSDGIVYVGGGSALYAINPNSTPKWLYLTSGGVVSSPAIGSNGVVYFGSLDSSVYAVNTANGNKKWSYKTGGQVLSSPAIGEDGTVYAAAADNKLYALHPDNGDLKWSYLMDSWGASSPVTGTDGAVYIGGVDGYLYSINSNGILNWRYFTSIGGIEFSTPTVGADGTIYVGAYDGYVYAIDTYGNLKWRYATGASVKSSPLVNGPDGILYVGSDDGYLYAIHATSSYAESSWPMFRHDCFRTGFSGWNP